MQMKRIFALVCCLVLLLAGCANGPLIWGDNVAMIGDAYLTQQEFETWYDHVKTFDDIMPESLCDMLCVQGGLHGEGALLAFVRYEVIGQVYGRASDADAKALLEELGLEETVDNLYCAAVYCTIDACKDEMTGDVTVTDEQVQAWYDQQVTSQSELAQSDLSKAQENYMHNQYDVAVYVPEGLKVIEVMAISCEKREASEAFSMGQAAWRRLIFNEPFADVFKEYNELDAYCNKDGTPKSFWIYSTWNEDPAIVLLAENLDEAGHLCPPTRYGDAYYILRNVQMPTSGAIAFDLVEDQCREAVLEENKHEAWAQIIDTMQHDAQVRFAPHR